MIVWPGLRRSVSAIQRLFNGASFSAPLTHSLVPERGTGSPTFTRATTATVKDHEGVLRTVPAGCARFEGARFVRNLVAGSSEDLTNASWTNYTGVPLSVTVSASDLPPGAAQATTIVTNGIYQGRSQVSKLTIGTTYLASYYAKGAVGGETVWVSDGVGTGGFPAVTNAWVKYTKVFVAANTSLTVGVASAGSTVKFSEIQLEDITGRADQTTPSEYVSVGVESAPYYHGSFVDGVKCFPTDISGNPIPASTLLGYVAEGARTNLCLQSNALTTTWTKDATLTLAQNAVGPDGATSAWTLTDASAIGASYISQDITLTAASYTMSFFVEKTTGAQSSYPVVLFYLAATTGLAGVTIDTTNGVATAWTAYTGFTGVNGSATCVSCNSTYWRVSLTFTGTAAAWTLRLYPAGTANATQSTGTLDITTQGSAVFYGAQVELGSFASSYIATTTIAVTRNADVLTYSGGDIPNLKTLTATFRRESGVSAASEVLALSDNTLNNTVVMQMDNATLVRSYGVAGGVTQWNQTASNSYTAGSDSKVAVTFATNDVKSFFAGTSMTADTSATVPVVTRLEVGMVTSLYQLYGTTKGIYGWTRNLSQSELQAVTA